MVVVTEAVAAVPLVVVLRFTVVVAAVGGPLRRRRRARSLCGVRREKQWRVQGCSVMPVVNGGGRGCIGVGPAKVVVGGTEWRMRRSLSCV